MYVYGLGDPRTGQICYVGITSNLYQRYAQHLLHSHNKGNIELIDELRVLDILPTLVALEKDVDEAIIYERERYWIEHYSQDEATLTNRIVPKSQKRHEEYYMVDEVAMILGLSERTVFRLIKKGELKGFKAGREWRFEESDIEDYIRQARAKAEQERTIGATDF